MLRHFVLGLQLSVLFIPLPLLIAWGGIAGHQGTLGTWELIWFDTIFETMLTVPCTLCGLLSFAMEPNYERVKITMSMEPDKCKRLGQRVINCLKLLW